MRETLAAIAGPQPPDLTPIRQVAPPEVVSIVQKMLEKEPAKRYQSANALICDLESVRHVAVPGLVARIVRSPAICRAAGTVALVGAIGLSISLLVHSNRQHPADKPTIVPLTYYPGYQENPAISPDSKEIAFVGQGKDGNRPFEVYVQLIGSTDPCGSPAFLLIQRTDSRCGTQARPASLLCEHAAANVLHEF